MRVKSFIKVIFSIPLLSSCYSTVPVEGNIGSSDTPMHINNYFSQSDVVTLDEDSCMVLGGASCAHYDNGKYYLLDDKYEKLVSFDEFGKSKAGYINKGNASDEYIKILDFDVDSDSVYVLCYPQKIFVLNNELKFKRKIDVPTGASRIAIWRNKLYVYFGENRSVSIYNNSNWEELIQEGCLPACPKVGVPVFFKTKNEMYYCAEGGNTIYEVNKNELLPFFSLTYPNQINIEDRIAQRKILDFDERLSMSPPFIYSMIETGGSLLITYSLGGIFRACTIDLETKSLTQDGYWYGKFPFPKSQIGNDCFSTSFVSLEDFPIDTLLIKVNHDDKNLENGSFTIIKYR